MSKTDSMLIFLFPVSPKLSFEVWILSLGTDGQDGPTDAAGAVADVQLIGKSGFSVAEAQQFLDNNDSYNFFAQAAGGDYHIKTGELWLETWFALKRF